MRGRCLFSLPLMKAQKASSASVSSIMSHCDEISSCRKRIASLSPLPAKFDELRNNALTSSALVSGILPSLRRMKTSSSPLLSMPPCPVSYQMKRQWCSNLELKA